MMSMDRFPRMSPLYRKRVMIELAFWKHKMLRKQPLGSIWAKNLQTKLNNLIPEKVHQAITFTIEKMVKGVLFGARHARPAPRGCGGFLRREAYVQRLVRNDKRPASIDGALKGAGGILLGIADFPAVLAVKIEMFF